MASFLAALKSWTPWAGGICGVVFCWLVLFLWQIPVLIYKDHNFLVSQANAPKPVCPVCTSCPICPKSVARPKSVAHDGEKFGEDRRQYVCGLQEYQRRLFSQALGEAPAGSLALIAVGDARDTPAKDCHDLLLSLFPSTKWTVGQVGGGTTTISSDTGFADSPFTCFAKDINSVAAKSLKNAFKSVDIVCDWSRRFSPLMRDGDVGILVNPMPH